MDKKELIRKLKGYEWTDIEFKEARNSLPRDIYETVSAFANTEGGSLVLGVREVGGSYEPVGIAEVDNVQNAFNSALRSRQKLNCVISAEQQMFDVNGKTLLVFHIPEAQRQDKPVHIENEIGRSYLRRGACNTRCTDADIERLLRDASHERYDAKIIDLDPEVCFNSESLKWYRKEFYNKQPDHDKTLSDLGFLNHFGLVVDKGEQFSPTLAAILLFGSEQALHRVLPRPVVDLRWHIGDYTDQLAEKRWVDRLVITNNLVESWQQLIRRYMQRAEIPFDIDPVTLQRRDRSPDDIAFREAAINLLIHQDYLDHTRTASINFFGDCTIFSNPGDAFTSAEDLLDSGGKELRNPRIVTALRLIGLSEQAGTGIRAIFDNWRKLGRIPPKISSDRGRKEFKLTLGKAELISEQQIKFQESLGLQLDDEEARVFAFACRESTVRPRDVRAVTSLSGTNVSLILNGLANKGLISAVGGPESESFDISERIGALIQSAKSQQSLRERYIRTVALSDMFKKLTATQKIIVKFCNKPRRLSEMMTKVNVKSRGYFNKQHLKPLLKQGILSMVYPEKASHPKQAYVVSEPRKPINQDQASEIEKR